jgi:parallel beta-helix repeat protein
MNKATALLLVLALLVTLFEAATLQVKAEPKTIVVVGDWMRIQGAISSAIAGDTVFVKKGTYAESTIVIDKAITLLGEDANTTVISNTDNPPWDGSFPPPPDTVAINITANNVRISGFTITGAIVSIAGGGDGTQIIGNIIENNVNLAGNNQTIADNKVTASFRITGSYNNISANINTGDHEGMQIRGSFNLVYGNVLTEGFAAGGIFVYGNKNIIAKNNITNCHVGISIENGSNNSVYSNRIVSIGGGLGVYGGFNNLFYSNLVSDKYVGVIIGAGRKDPATGQPLSGNSTVYHNNFVNNTYPVKTDYEIFSLDYWDNGSEGNYWSDYGGNDTNHDGIGDNPYIIDENRRDNFPLMLPFDIENNRVVIPPVEPANSGAGSGTNLIVASAAGALVIAVVAVVAGWVYLKKRKPPNAGVVKNP